MCWLIYDAIKARRLLCKERLENQNDRELAVFWMVRYVALIDKDIVQKLPSYAEMVDTKDELTIACFLNNEDYALFREKELKALHKVINKK